MISFINGPLPAHVIENPKVRYCAPDADIPLSFANLPRFPLLHKLDNVRGDFVLVYLECHRAPDSVYATLLKKKCPVICQGDAESLRPKDCSVFASQLAACPRLPPPKVHLHWVDTISEALLLAQGRTRILTSNRDSVATVMSHLRPDGDILPGDPVFDRRSGQLACVKHRVKSSAPRSTVIHLDTGRCTTYGKIWRRLVESPCSWGSGECDTLIVLPDVCEFVGSSASRRVRYQVVSVGVAPTIYGFTSSV